MNATELKYEKKWEDIIKAKVLDLFNDTGAKIFLFGSRARGDFFRGSDIDIGIESVHPDVFRKKKIEFGLFWEECIVPAKVDIILFDEAGPEFIKESKRDIVIWKSA